MGMVTVVNPVGTSTKLDNAPASPVAPIFEYANLRINGILIPSKKSPSGGSTVMVISRSLHPVIIKIAGSSPIMFMVTDCSGSKMFSFELKLRSPDPPDASMTIPSVAYNPKLTRCPITVLVRSKLLITRNTTVRVRCLILNVFNFKCEFSFIFTWACFADVNDTTQPKIILS